MAERKPCLPKWVIYFLYLEPTIVIESAKPLSKIWFKKALRFVPSVSKTHIPPSARLPPPTQYWVTD